MKLMRMIHFNGRDTEDILIYCAYETNDPIVLHNHYADFIKLAEWNHFKRVGYNMLTNEVVYGDSLSIKGYWEKMWIED